MTSGAGVPEFTEVSLKSLNLRAGMFLQTQRLQKNSPNYEAQFLGAIDEKCLMLVPVGTFSIKTGMKAGETFIIRGFTGQFDFCFSARVIQAFDFTFREPAYAYAVLTFPESVQARKVRNSIRIKTSLPATVTASADQIAQPVTIIDLSADGALLRSSESLGAVGECSSLEFSMGLDGELSYVVTMARICHVHLGDDGYLTGMLFESISTADRLMIREFVLVGLQ